jgi:hypothetical protein
MRKNTFERNGARSGVQGRRGADHGATLAKPLLRILDGRPLIVTVGTLTWPSILFLIRTGLRRDLLQHGG